MNLPLFAIFLCLFICSDANQNDETNNKSDSRSEHIINQNSSNNRISHDVLSISPNISISIPRSTSTIDDTSSSCISQISHLPHFTTLTDSSKLIHSIPFTGLSSFTSNVDNSETPSSAEYSRLTSDLAVSLSATGRRLLTTLTNGSTSESEKIQVALRNDSVNQSFESSYSSIQSINKSYKMPESVSHAKRDTFVDSTMLSQSHQENSPSTMLDSQFISNTTATVLASPEKIPVLLNISDEEATGDAIAEQALNQGLENLTDVLNSSDHEPVLTNEEKAYFITFEEWKRQKIAQELKERAKRKESEDGKQKRIKANRAQGQNSNLDYPFGEEMEFEASLFTDDDTGSSDNDKSYKGRFNYASLDCAATIVKTNKEAKGATAILNANKDTYLLNQCKASNSFVIVELCEDILIDEVLIGNFEFFSSVFKDIRVSVSDRYPSPDWKVIGEFTAKNLRNLQTFHISDPKIWAKFLKVEFLSHYGNEYYCPISSLQVHGKTMMEQFKEEAHQPSIAKELRDISVDEIANGNLQNAGEDRNVTPEVQQEVEPENCVIRPHLGLEQFLEQRKNVQAAICIQNFTDEVANSSMSSISRNGLVDAPTSSAAGIQESIYQNIIKRLSVLESNATLSLLYIEEQSKILSAAFESLESRQSKSFDGLIGQMNATVQSQISNFKRLNSELSENFEQFFNYQNSRFQNVLLSNEDRLDRFQRSLNFQKKMNFLSLVIIIFLLAYIISMNNGTDADYIYSLPNSPANTANDATRTHLKLHSRQNSPDKTHSSESSLSETSIPHKAQDFVDRIFHRQRPGGSDTDESENETTHLKKSSQIEVVSVQLAQSKKEECEREKENMKPGQNKKEDESTKK